MEHSRFLIVQAAFLVCAALAVAGCKNESQLVWHYEMIMVQDAIHTTARQDRAELFTEGQIRSLLKNPNTLYDSRDLRGVSGSASAVRSDVLELALSCYLQYERGRYAERLEDQGAPTEKEKEAFQQCLVWVYVEQERFHSPLPGSPYLRYLIVFEDGQAVGAAISPEN